MKMLMLAILATVAVDAKAANFNAGEKVLVKVGAGKPTKLLAEVVNPNDSGFVVVRYCDSLQYRYFHLMGAIDGTMFVPDSVELAADQSSECSSAE